MSSVSSRRIINSRGVVLAGPALLAALAVAAIGLQHRAAQPLSHPVVSRSMVVLADDTDDDWVQEQEQLALQEMLQSQQAAEQQNEQAQQQFEQAQQQALMDEQQAGQ